MNYLTDEQIAFLAQCGECEDCSKCPVYPDREPTHLLCFDFTAEQLRKERERYKQAEETIGILLEEKEVIQRKYDKLLTCK